MYFWFWQFRSSTVGHTQTSDLCFCLASCDNLLAVFMASCNFTTRLVQPLIMFSIHAWLSQADRSRTVSPANQPE